MVGERGQRRAKEGRQTSDENVAEVLGPALPPTENGDRVLQEMKKKKKRKKKKKTKTKEKRLDKEERARERRTDKSSTWGLGAMVPVTKRIYGTENHA